MTDTQTTIFECKKAVDSFLIERDWHQFHSPKIDSIGLVVEAGELLELFLFCQPNDGGQRVLLEIGQSGARYKTVTDNAVNISCKASLLYELIS